MAGPPKGIIIHAMGEFVNHQYAPDFLKSVGLSVHAFIAVDGKVLLASEPNRIAFHAGKSALDTMDDLNDFFLGVELLVEGHHNMATFKKAIGQSNTYKEAQYEAVAALCAEWVREFSIDRQYIVGHSDVSGPAVRRDPKVDPGPAFDWSRFHTLVDDFLVNPPVATTPEGDEEE